MTGISYMAGSKLVQPIPKLLAWLETVRGDAFFCNLGELILEQETLIRFPCRFLRSLHFV